MLARTARWLLAAGWLLGVAGAHADGRAAVTTPDTLRLATWDIYCDPARPDQPLGWREFEQRTGAKLRAVVFATNDDILAAVRAGRVDACVASCDIAPVLIEEGLTAPLPTERLAHYRDLLPNLRHVRYGRRDGRDHCVPFTWGVMALAYDTSVFPTPPASWQVLWDPAWRGRVAHWDDISVLWTAALAAGHREVFALQGQALWEAGRRAARLCEGGVLLWQDQETSVRAMATGQVVLNVAWPDAAGNANRWPGRTSGAWALAYPQEGVTAFIDNLCVARGTPRFELAVAYVEIALGAEVQRALGDNLDFSPVCAEVAAGLTPARRAQLHLDDPNFLNRAYLWRPIPNRSEYQRIWDLARGGRLLQ